MTFTLTAALKFLWKFIHFDSFSWGEMLEVGLKFESLFSTLSGR